MPMLSGIFLSLASANQQWMYWDLSRTACVALWLMSSFEALWGVLAMTPTLHFRE